MGRKVSRKTAARKQSHLNFVVDDFAGIDAVPRRKKWSTHDLKQIQPKTETQRQFLEGWFNGDGHICAHGSAGTGKSFLAVYAALASLLDPSDPTKQITIVRSAVSTRAIGHLPGTVEEKQAPYEQPFVDLFATLLGRQSTYQDMKDAKQVNFMLTSNVRGLTWNDAVVIVDEAQNMTMMELDSVITRMGHNSRLILLGDSKYQQDLGRNEVSGFSTAIAVLSRMSDIDVVTFTPADIVRSEFVREWIMTREELNV